MSIEAVGQETQAPRRQVLMNPGPVMTDPRVRAALEGPDLCHREREFSALMVEVRDKLVAVGDGDARHSAVVLTGSGTAGLEAVVGSVVPDKGKVLVLDNGHYGERLFDIASALKVQVQRLEFGCGVPLDREHLRRKLEDDAELTHVAMVQHETSSGMLNSVREVAQVVHTAGRELILDAISSFGAEELSLREGDADWVVGSSNKCLEGMPGLCFVLAQGDAFNSLQQVAARSFYLDLGCHYRAQVLTGSPAFTPGIPAYYALSTALDLTLAETVPERRRRYGAMAETLRRGLEDLGLRLALPPHHRAVSLTAIELPPGVAYADLHRALKVRGYVIYAGQAALARSHFRLSTMGQMEPGDITRFLADFADTLRELRNGGRHA